MSIAAEQWKAEGIQIGEIKGKAAGIEAGKADLSCASYGGASAPCPSPLRQECYAPPRTS